MPSSTRISIVFATLGGASGVILGALGAHALRPALESTGALANWQTAVQYHLFHSIALLVLAAGPAAPDSGYRLRRWSTALFGAGIVLFSGALYLLALGAPRWVAHFAPFGGLCFIAGWLTAGLALWRRQDCTTK
jgi:uncharacterized membrane protein YgdD (TMEM256/DUF423 family)